MSLLQIDRVSVRFGGIAAVNDLSLTVEEGRIFSIIGPNGAGKTTLFNAITGIHAPSTGTIRFQGREVKRPLRGTVFAGILSVGVFVAILAYFAAAGVDQLWAASIKRPFAHADDRFDLGRMASAAHEYLLGRPALLFDPDSARWKVVGLDGTTLATVPDEERARAARDRLLAGPPTVQARGNEWDAIAMDGTLIDRFKNEAEARRDKRVTAWADGNALRTATRIAPQIGLGLGLLGGMVVWFRSRRTPDLIARNGIARTFQNIRLFQAMTVLENVLVGLDRSLTAHPLWMALGTPRHRREEADARLKASELLAFVGLEGAPNELAKNLPYGDQRRLEIARALATEPKLLLLDEPAAGMNPNETTDLMRLIRKIRERGVTVLLIEHHMSLVMGISDRVAVLDYGVKIAEGTPAEVSRNRKVIEAYLGKDEET